MEKEKPWLRVRMIVEVAGFPKENVDSALVQLGEKFGEGTPEIKVTSKKVKPPVQVQDSKLLTGFLEFEADIKNLSTLIGIIFDYMPSSIEIIEPEVLSEEIPNLNPLLNDLASRLHQYDMLVKQLRAQKVLLRKKIEAKAEDKESENKEEEKARSPEQA